MSQDTRRTSRENWNSDTSLESINTGSLQRIADATERMATAPATATATAPATATATATATAPATAKSQLPGRQSPPRNILRTKRTQL